MTASAAENDGFPRSCNDRKAVGTGTSKNVMNQNMSKPLVNNVSLEWPAKLCSTIQKKRPYYRWLQTCILSFIEEKIWKSGHRIPNEWDIAKQTGLNVNTVKKALLELVQQGYLIRTPRRGTYIAGYNGSAYRYFLLKKPGSDDACTDDPLHFSRIDVLENTLVPGSDLPTELANDGLQIKVVRLFFLREAPLLFTTSWLKAELFPGFLDISSARIMLEPLYRIIDKDYSIIVRKSTELLSVGHADARLAKLLDVSFGSPLLVSNILNHTDGGVIFERKQSYINTAEYSLLRAP